MQVTRVTCEDCIVTVSYDMRTVAQLSIRQVFLLNLLYLQWRDAKLCAFVDYTKLFMEALIFDSANFDSANKKTT